MADSIECVLQLLRYAAFGEAIAACRKCQFPVPPGEPDSSIRSWNGAIDLVIEKIQELRKETGVLTDDR
jgi:hypothetical protein